MPTIEAGHFYIYGNPEKRETLAMSDEQLVGIELAAQLAVQSDTALEFLLFVDDLHGHPDLSSNWEDEELLNQLIEQADVQAVLEYFQEIGIQPTLISELQMTSSAVYLYSELVRKGSPLKGKRFLITGVGDVTLLNDEKQPSCSLIDAALYLKKIGIAKADPTTTVLPHHYKSQQDQVKAILSAYGLSAPPITIIYHDEHGQVCEVDDWSQGGV